MEAIEPTRVLLIEDNEDDFLIVERLLRKIFRSSYHLVWKDNWEEGLAALLDGNFDVALLDYCLGGPHGSLAIPPERPAPHPGQPGSRKGLDLIRHALAEGCRRPLILLTGHKDPRIDHKAIRVGAADYLMKDRLDANILERSIRHSLERQRALDALAQAQNDLECKVAERTVELTRANRELAAANQRKNEFIAMLGHELRNPLTPVASGLDLLSVEQLPAAERKATCETMRKHLDHLRRIVDDLLDVARLTHGKIVANRKVIDWNLLITEIAEQSRESFASANRTLIVDCPEHALWIEGDSDLLTQVVRNLLHNALKFTDRGDQVCVRLHAGDSHAVATVEDNGIGIEPDQLTSLFEPFSQADRSLDRSKGGLGLGLAFASGVLEQHDGTITAASDGVGKGAVFSMRLPLTSPPEPAETVAPTFATAGHESMSQSTSAEPKRILVIEDHRDAAEMIKTLLTYQGYQVALAFTGAEGLQRAETACPDIILCDIGLPGMDGYQVVERLRQQPQTADLFVVAISGYGHPEALARSREVGFDEHLVKPLDMSRLQEILAQRCAVPCNPR